MRSPSSAGSRKDFSAPRQGRQKAQRCSELRGKIRTFETLQQTRRQGFWCQGGMNRPRSVIQKRVSTNSSSHHDLQRSSVRLGIRIHLVSWLTRQSVRPARTAPARTTTAARYTR